MVLKWPGDRGGDTLRYLARLPLFSFPDNVLDTKVTSPYFVVRTGQDNSQMREISKNIVVVLLYVIIFIVLVSISFEVLSSVEFK